MPGKSGPERINRQGTGNDIFLLRGAVPIPKPSYGQPRRASYSGDFVTRSQSVDTTPYSYHRRLSSVSSSEEPSGTHIGHSRSIDYCSSSSGTIWSSSKNHNPLLEKASLDKSVESELGDENQKNLSQSQNLSSAETKGTKPLTKSTGSPETSPSNSSSSSAVVSGRHRIVVISGKECVAVPKEEQDPVAVLSSIPGTTANLGQGHQLSSHAITDAPPPLPLTPIPSHHNNTTVEYQDKESYQSQVTSEKAENVVETSPKTVKPPVLSGLERLRLIEEEHHKDCSEKGTDPVIDSESESQTRPVSSPDTPSWTAAHFSDRRDVFERMASQDTGQILSDSELHSTQPSISQKSERASADLDNNTADSKKTSSGSESSSQWVPSDTVLTEKKVSEVDSDLSTHSLGGNDTAHIASSGAFVSKVKENFAKDPKMMGSSYEELRVITKTPERDFTWEVKSPHGFLHYRDSPKDTSYSQSFRPAVNQGLSQRPNLSNLWIFPICNQTCVPTVLTDGSVESSDSSPDEQHHAQLHKTASTEDVSFSSHLSPHHEKHYKLHKTASEEDVSVMKNTPKEPEGVQVALQDCQEFVIVKEGAEDQQLMESKTNIDMESNSDHKTSPTVIRQVKEMTKVSDEASSKEGKVSKNPSPQNIATLVFAELKQHLEMPKKLKSRNLYTDEVSSSVRSERKVKSEVISDIQNSESSLTDGKEKDAQEEMEKKMYQQEEITMHVDTIMVNNEQAKTMNDVDSGLPIVEQTKQNYFEMADSLQEFFYNGQMVVVSTSGYNASDESGSDIENYEKKITFPVRKDIKPDVNSSFAELKSITSSDTRATSPQDGRFVEPNKMKVHTYYFKKIHPEESSGAEESQVARYQRVQNRKRRVKPSHLDDDFTASDVGYTTEVVSSPNEGDHDTPDDQMGAVLGHIMSKEEKLQLQSILSSSNSVKKRDSKVHFDESHLSETKYYKPSETSKLETPGIDGGKQVLQGGHKDSSSEEDMQNTEVNCDQNRKTQRLKNKSVRKRNKYPEIYSRSVIGTTLNNNQDSKEENAKALPFVSLPNLSPAMIQTLAHTLNSTAVKEALSAESQTEAISLSDAASYEISRFISVMLQKALESLTNVEYIPEENSSEDINVKLLPDSVPSGSAEAYEQEDNSGRMEDAHTDAHTDANLRADHDTTSADGAAGSSKLVEHYESLIRHRDKQRYSKKRNKGEKPSKDAKITSKSAVCATTEAKQKSTDRPGQLAFGSLPSLSPTAVHALSQQIKPLVLEEMMTIDGQRETMTLPDSVSDEITRLLSSLLQRVVESILQADVEDGREHNGIIRLQTVADNINSSSAESVQRIDTIDGLLDHVSEDKDSETKQAIQEYDEEHHIPSNGAYSVSYPTPSKLLRKIRTREHQYEKGGVGSFETITSPSELLMRNQKSEEVQSAEKCFGKDEILHQLRNSVDQIANVQGMLERASFNKSTSTLSSKSVPLPISKVEDRLMQLEQRSTPISTSPTKLLPKQGHIEEVQTRGCETNVDGYQYVDISGSRQEKSFMKRTDLSKGTKPVSTRNNAMEIKRNEENNIDKTQKSAKELGLVKSQKISTQPGTAGSKSTNVSELPVCKTPEELQSVIDTMKHMKHKPVTDRNDIDLGLDRSSELLSNDCFGSPFIIEGNPPLTEKDVCENDADQKRLEATLSWIAQQDQSYASVGRPRQTLPSRDSGREQGAGREATSTYRGDMSQAEHRKERIEDDDESTDAMYLPVTQSMPIPNHVMSSVAKLIFQKHFHDKATSDPQLSPEALEMLFSLMTAESTDESLEGFDASDSTYSSSVLSSSNNMATAQDADESKLDEEHHLDNSTLSPGLTKTSDTSNTSSADSMDTNAPSSELQSTTDLEGDALPQNSLASCEVERGVTKGLFGSKTPSDLMIEKIVRLYHQRSISKPNTGDIVTDALTRTLKVDKTTSTGDSLCTNSSYLPPVSHLSDLPGFDDVQKSQEVLGSGLVSSSRGASPGADQALSTGRKSAMGSTDMRSYLIEKELIESQLRKLQVENSSLHTENKLLKEKYNRGQARIVSLENEMLSQRQEAESMHSTLDEMSATSRKSRSHREQERMDLEDKVLRLTGEVDRLKAENVSLERQLDSFRKSSDVLKHTSDRSQLIEGFRGELTAMRVELSKMKDLLDQAEKDRMQESEKRKEASAQVVKLTELKVLLQQQIENSGGSVAEKQVKSLESRLKITEDRLHQERSDRAEKLSEVEEKLLSENAKLQVTEKEQKRQLQREKDKNRNLDNKYKAIKEDSEKLQVILAEKPASMQNMPYHAKYAAIKPSLTNKKASDMKYIQDQLKQEDNLSANQSEDAIWLLWQRNQELTKCLKQWELQLGDLGVDYNNITEGLQTLRSDLEMYDDKLQHYKDALDDSKREKDSLEQSLKRQLKELVHEKHSSQAHIKNLEDQCAAVRAENDSLLKSIRMSSGMAPTKQGETNTTWEAQVESLKLELHTTRSDLQQNVRHNQRLEAELESVWGQHKAKEKALAEALDELTSVGTSDKGKEELEQYQQQKLDKLSAQVRHLEVEANHWRDKYESVKRDKDILEDGISQLQKQLSRAKFTTDGRIMDPSTEAEKSALEEELNEKDLQVMHLTVSYNETENNLQRTKQLLVLQQQANDQLTQQMDQLHTDVRQKNYLLEKMASSEAENQVEVASMRENLLAVNAELSKLTEELKLRSIELEHNRSKVSKLEQDLNERDEVISCDITQALRDGRLSSVLVTSEMSTADDTLTQAETQARLLQYEVEKLKHQSEKSNGVMENLVRENTNLVSKNRHIKQELVQERARLCQLTSEKAEVEQRFRITEESEKCLIHEKASLEQDITKQEVHLGNLIDRLEKEAESVQRDYEDKYQQLDKEGKKLAIEFTTVKHLLQAREREIELLRDTIGRQKQENSSLGRQLQVIKEENSNNQQQIENLTKDLTRKTKEQDVQKEMSQTLASERARLQLEKSQLEQQQTKEHDNLHTRLVELQALQKKLEKAEDLQRQTENRVHQKGNQLAATETDLRHAKKDAAQAENEKMSLKNQVNTLNEEVRHLRSVKDTLDQRSNLEKNTLSKEKQDKTSTKDELLQAQQQLDVVKREYDILYATLEQDKKVLHTVKAQCQAEEDKGLRLQEEMVSLQRQLDSVHHELDTTKETLEQYKHEKQTLCHDIQDLCSQLSEKDLVMTRLKDKTEDSIDAMRNEYTLEKSYILQEKQKAENELYKAREELDEMKEKLQQKEHQVDLFMRTTKDLENDVREKYELQNELSKFSAEVKEAQKTVSRLEADNARLNEASRHLQENLRESRDTTTNQKVKIQQLEEELVRETRVLKKQSEEHQGNKERETLQLNDLLNKTKLELKAAQASLTAAQESRESLLEANKNSEKNIESLKTRLHEELIGRKLAEQRAETVTGQLEEVKGNKNTYSSMTTELQARYAKIEAELNVEKQRFLRLQKEFEELQGTNTHSLATAKSLEQQLSETESENNSLRSQLQTTKHDYSGKNKRLSLEVRQTSENYEKDRTKLMAQAQQLATDLDRVREQLAAKNRESLSLQEEMLTVEAQMREVSSEAKHLRESIKLEQETRDKLDRRNMELELLVAKLHSKDGSGTDSAYEATKAEVQRMLSELSRRMQDQLDQQKGSDHEARSRDQRKLEELKQKVSSLESVLSQEQALHIVSKTQLQSLEEDNQRLRQTIQSMRKRQMHTDSSDRTKSRIEAINEIIAKSQSQAHQMLASGTFNLDASDSPFKLSGPSYTGGQHVSVPNSQYWNLTSTSSPRVEQNHSMGSEDLSMSMLNGTSSK